jgi:hypothetical protein
MSDDELTQYMRIAIWQALVKYTPERGCPLDVWVKWCVRRDLYDLGRKRGTVKYNFYRKFISESELTEVKQGQDAMFRVLTTYDAKIEQQVIGKEFEAMLRSILTPFEDAVLNLYIIGVKVKDMPLILKGQGFETASYKAIDNARARIKKRKIPLIIEAQNRNLPLEFDRHHGKTIKKTPQ